MAEWVTGPPSFQDRIIFHCEDRPHVLYAFIYTQTFGLHFLALVNNAAMHGSVQISFETLLPMLLDVYTER